VGIFGTGMKDRVCMQRVHAEGGSPVGILEWGGEEECRIFDMEGKGEGQGRGAPGYLTMTRRCRSWLANLRVLLKQQGQRFQEI
jgi:hypothetical protein